MTTGYDNVIAALEKAGLTTQDMYGYVMAQCPAHDDDRASLSIKEGDDGRALIYCHAGCLTSDVVAALDLGVADLFSLGTKGPVADVYVYTDEDGKPLSRVCRLSPKGFTQQHWDTDSGTWQSGVPRSVRRVLYRLPQVLKAAAEGRQVYVVEGEKDVESLVAIGVEATCNIGGASKWRDEYTDQLRGAQVVLVPDGDEAGRESADRIAASLTAGGVGFDVQLPRAGKDVTEHLRLGYGLQDLVTPELDLDLFQPFEYTDFESAPVEWLYEPYIPATSRVLAFGKAGSLKSLWAMWVGARLSREGHRVAYFSLEMTPSELAKRVKACHVDEENFKVYRRFNMANPQHVMMIIRALKGFSLIVVDSWSSAHTGADNDEVARLDNEVFIPIIEQTGATLLIIDNTGHDVVTERGVVKQQHARGASAKGDKMDYSLWFDKPVEDNNYRTRIVVKKVRIDYESPEAKVFETSRGDVEFYSIKDDGTFGPSAWPKRGAVTIPSGLESTAASLEAGVPESRQEPTAPVTEVPAPASSLTSQERRALARLQDSLGAVPVT